MVFQIAELAISPRVVPGDPGENREPENARGGIGITLKTIKGIKTKKNTGEVSLQPGQKDASGAENNLRTAQLFRKSGVISNNKLAKPMPEKKIAAPRSTDMNINPNGKSRVTLWLITKIISAKKHQQCWQATMWRKISLQLGS